MADRTPIMNVFGLEEREDDGQWHEWYDEKGYDIEEHFGDPDA